MDLVMNTLKLNASIKEHPQQSKALFGRRSEWHFGYTLWLGNPNNRLIVSHSSSGDMEIAGRGRFENVDNVDLLVFNDDIYNSRFVLLVYDENGLPVLPGGFIGVDVNCPGVNNSSESFELRFIGANFAENLYAFGFCASDPGEPDVGVFIVSNKRKQAILSYNVAQKSQRLHGNPEQLKSFLISIMEGKSKE